MFCAYMVVMHTRQQMKKSIAYVASSDVKTRSLKEPDMKGKEGDKLRAVLTLFSQHAPPGWAAGLAFWLLHPALAFRDKKRSFCVVSSMPSIPFYVQVKLSEINQL